MIAVPVAQDIALQSKSDKDGDHFHEFVEFEAIMDFWEMYRHKINIFDVEDSNIA